MPRLQPWMVPMAPGELEQRLVAIEGQNFAVLVGEDLLRRAVWSRQPSADGKSGFIVVGMRAGKWCYWSEYWRDRTPGWDEPTRRPPVTFLCGGHLARRLALLRKSQPDVAWHAAYWQEPQEGP